MVRQILDSRGREHHLILVNTTCFAQQEASTLKTNEGLAVD